MGTHLRVLSKSYPMNTNITGFRCFFKKICVLILWTKVASALKRERLILDLFKIFIFDLNISLPYTSFKQVIE